MKRFFILIIGLFEWLCPMFCQNWNLVWREDFGVAEDTVIRDFADATKSVPRHSFAGYESKAHYGSMGTIEYHEAGEWQGECGYIDDGQYGIANSTWWAYNRFAACGVNAGHFVGGRDHTGNEKGAMLIVNSEVGEGEAIYQQDIEFNLCESREYKFVVYAASITAYQDGGNAHLQLNVVNKTTGMTIKSIDTGLIPFWSFGEWGSGYTSDCIFCEREWTEFSCEFTANDGDKLQLQVVNYGSGYNDFAIDDISLYRNDEVVVIDPMISSNTISSESVISAGNCIYMAAFSVPEEVLDNWKKIYEKVYFLWQRSEDDGLTWSNILDVSGVEKLSVEIEVNKDKKEVYRVIITGASTDALAEEQALYVALHGGPRDGCSYFSISNTLAGVSPTPDCTYREDARTIWSQDFGVIDSFSTRSSASSGCGLTYYETNGDGFSKGNYVVVSAPDAAIKKTNYNWDNTLAGYSYDEPSIKDASGVVNGAFFYTYFGKTSGDKCADLLIDQIVEGPFCNCKTYVFSFQYYDTNEWAGENLRVQVLDENDEVLGVSSLIIGHDNSRAWNRQITPFSVPNGYKGRIRLQIINETPTNDWNRIAFDNLRIDVCGESAPKASIQIDGNPSVALLSGFDCNEEPAKTISVADDAIWKKLYPNYGVAWERTIDGGISWIYLGSGKNVTHDDSEGQLAEYRAVFAETEEAAIEAASRLDEKPSDPCLMFAFSNRVGLQCDVSGCNAPKFEIEGDTVTEVCSDTSSAIIVRVKQTNATHVDAMQWYRKSFDADNWTEMDGQTTEVLAISELPLDSTDYLFIAVNDTCYSDSIFFRLNIHQKISVEELMDTTLCKNDDLKVKPSILSGSPTETVWVADKKSEPFGNLSIENVQTQQHVDLYFTDGVCKSNTIGFDIHVQEPISFSPVPEIIVCEGDSFSIDPKVTGDVYEVVWGEYKVQKSDDGMSIISPVFEEAALNSDDIHVELKGVKCPSQAFDVKLTVKNKPQVSLTSDKDSICSSDEVELTGVFENADHVVWMCQDANGEPKKYTETNNSVIDVVTTMPTADTKFWIEIPSGGGCDGIFSDTIEIFVEQPIDVTIDAPDASICAGNAIDLSATIISGQPFEYGWNKNGVLLSSDVSASDTPTENVEFEFFANSRYCESISKSFEVEVETSSDLSLIASANKVCASTTIELTADFGKASNVEWLCSTDNVAFERFSSDLVKTQSFKIGNDENYYFKLKTTGNGSCPVVYSATIKVEVEAPLQVAWQDVSTVCAGTKLNFTFDDMTEDEKQRYSYSWSENGEEIATSLELSTEVVEDTKLNLEIVSEVCPLVSHLYDIKVQQLPEVSISASKTKICMGESVRLNVEHESVSSLTWKSADLVGGNVTTIGTDLVETKTLTPSESCIYWVEFGGDDVCPNAVNSDFVEILVEHPVSLSLSSSKSAVCYGNEVELTAVADIGSDNSIIWKKNGAEMIVTNLSFVDAPEENSVYEITVRGDACPDLSESIEVGVEKSDELTLVASANLICEGDAVTLASSFGDATSLVWEQSKNGGDFVEFSDLLTNEIGIEPDVSTSYRLKTVGSGVCNQVYSNIVNVAVEDSIRFEVASVPSVVCGGEAIELHAVLSSGVTGNHLWKKNGVTLSSDARLTDVPTALTTYEFMAQGNACPAVSQSFNVDVEQPVELSLSSSKSEICGGGKILLRAVYGKTKSLLWEESVEGGEFSVFDEQIVATKSVQPSASTVYRLRTQDDGVCPQFFSEEVAVSVEQPISLSLRTDVLICPDQSATLTPSVSGRPLSYEWYAKTDIADAYMPVGDTNSEMNVSPTATTFYKVVAHASVCEDSEAETIVRVDEVGTLDLISNTEHICEGDEVLLSASFGYLPNIVWSEKTETSEAFKEIASGEEKLSLTPTESTVYRVKASSEANCPADEVEVVVKVDKAVNISLKDLSICKGDTALLKINGLTDYESIEWKTSLSNDQMLKVAPVQSSEYTVTVANGLCSGTATSVVTVVDPPRVISCEETDRKTYEVEVESATYPIYYDFGDGRGATMSNVLENAVYGRSYEITVSNDLNCSSSYTLVTPTYEIEIPEYFNPEENRWVVSNLDRYSRATVQIFDRYGKMLVEMDDHDTDGWDGTYNGRKMPSTDYWYVIMIGEIDAVYKGHFTLIRGN